MASVSKVLVVEDQIGAMRPTLDFIESKGYSVILATNEEAAKRRLDEISEKKASYALAIFDVMVSVKDFMDVVDLDDNFYEASRDTGIRLCQYARRQLRIPADELPIVCLSGRDDQELKDAMKSLDIPLFNRTPSTPEESLRNYIKEHLPKVEKSD